jgi:hypothetical protein
MILLQPLFPIVFIVTIIFEDYYNIYKSSKLLTKCVGCDGSLEDGEYLYKGKSYCDDCYGAAKKLEAIQQEIGT